MVITDVTTRLETLGYTVAVGDTGLLEYLMQNIEASIIRDLNIDVIPDDVVPFAVDRVCGEFLKTKKSTSPTDFFVDISNAVASISEGDTSISFVTKDSTPEQRFDKLVNMLINGHNEVFDSLRRFKW